MYNNSVAGRTSRRRQASHGGRGSSAETPIEFSSSEDEDLREVPTACTAADPEAAEGGTPRGSTQPAKRFRIDDPKANGGIVPAISLNSSTYSNNAVGTTSNNTGLDSSTTSRQPQQQQQQQQVSKPETLDLFNLIPLVVR